MLQVSEPDVSVWRAAIITALVGTAGGGLFTALDLPAPWMSGALVATTLWALAGRPMAVPDPVRWITFVLLGASMGAALSSDTLAQARNWPISMACLAASVVAVIACCMLYFRKVAGWDLATALYASAPGALSAVIAMAETTDADMRKVAFSQGLRMFLLVAALPHLLGMNGHGPVPAMLAVPSAPAAVVGVILASAAAAFLFARARIPGGMLLGAMTGSAGLHLSGLSDAHLPPVLLIPAFIVLGASVGIRFQGTQLAVLRSSALAALGGFAVAMAISLGMAVLAAALTGEEAGKMIAAFAPGALETMTALGFAMGYDPAFMTAHHLFRFAALSVALPLSAHLLFTLSSRRRR